MPRVFLGDLLAGYDTAIGEAMEFLSDAAALRPGLRVSVKPNLTFPVYRRGVIQDPGQRLKLHPFFPNVIYALHQALPRTIVAMDGRYGLNRNGPMRGEATELNWLLASDSVFHADLVMARLLGVDWRRVAHLRFFARREPAGAFDRIESTPTTAGLRRRGFAWKGNGRTCRAGAPSTRDSSLGWGMNRGWRFRCTACSTVSASPSTESNA